MRTIQQPVAQDSDKLHQFVFPAGEEARAPRIAALAAEPRFNHVYEARP